MEGGMHGGGCGGGMRGRGYTWQGLCMAGGVHGGGSIHVAGQALQGGMHGGGGMCGGGHAWQGACMAGGMHGGGVHGRGACVAGEGGLHGRRDGHCSGQYVSYWNAFLFLLYIYIKSSQV